MFRWTAVVLLFIFLISPVTTFAQQSAPLPTTATTAAAQTQPTSQTPTKDPNDPIERIKDEAKNRSQGYANVELSQRRHWTALNCVARIEKSQRVDARPVDDVGT